MQRKPHTLRTVILSVLSTIVAMFIGLAVLGTVMPAHDMQPCIVKLGIVKSSAADLHPALRNS